MKLHYGVHNKQDIINILESKVGDLVALYPLSEESGPLAGYTTGVIIKPLDDSDEEIIYRKQQEVLNEKSCLLAKEAKEKLRKALSK